MKVPVLFIIFNRLDIASKSFEAIKEYKPEQLYIAADGPRQERLGEDILCEKTRKGILDMIDWECEVKTLFRETNAGVDMNVYSAINWMFEQENWGVIVEDDCYVSTDFFTFCETVLPQYHEDEKIMHVIANNPFARIDSGDSYSFISHPISWGWATWAYKWHKYMDLSMTDQEKISVYELSIDHGWLMAFLYKRYWRKNQSEKTAFVKPWDTIWQYSVIRNKGLCILPDVNLAVNNGIGTSEGSHYNIGDSNYYEGLTLGHMRSPYKCRSDRGITSEAEMDFNHYFLRLRMFGLKNRIKKLLRLGQYR